MRFVKIRQVKREIRILGINIVPWDKGHWIVGVVYRGGLFMDGVMNVRTDKKSLTEAIVSMIMNSPHFKQIRVITFDRDLINPETEVNSLFIFEKTGKPVIVLGEEMEDFNPFKESFIWNSRKVVTVGLAASSARRVLEVSTVTGSVPESLRVAQLIVLGGSNEL